MNLLDSGPNASQHGPLRDIELAREKLAAEVLSLVVVKQGQTLFTSSESGVRGLIEAIRECGSSLNGAALADRIVGKAAALLCAYAKISRVYACVMSRPGSAVLRRFLIPFEHRTLVRNILDRHKTGICPFEKLVLDVDSPNVAFTRINKCLIVKASKRT